MPRDKEGDAPRFSSSGVQGKEETSSPALERIASSSQTIPFIRGIARPSQDTLGSKDDSFKYLPTENKEEPKYVSSSEEIRNIPD